MTYEITRENAGELIDVAELLHGTYGNVTESGVLIDKHTDGWGIDVIYSLPEAPDEPFRTLTATEYAAEFALATGLFSNEMDFASMAKHVDQCRYIGRWLAEPMIYRGMLTFDDIKALQTAPPKADTRSLSEISGSARCMDDDARRGF